MTHTHQKNKAENMPLAVFDHLIVQEMGDETLIYDTVNNEAHCLNQTAALIWKNCTGSFSPEEIAGRMSVAIGQTVPVEMVDLALAQLKDRKLVGRVSGERLKGASRRELIKKVGLASVVALPLISSLVVPKNVLAQSSICGAPTSCTCNGRGSNGGSCFSSNCISGCTCRNLMGCNPGGNQCVGTCEA